MKTSELRIGNYVECNGINVIITELLSPRPRKPDYFNNVPVVELFYGGLTNALLSEINPIPLTEEILLKCGFEINGKYYRSKYIQDSIKLIYDFNQRVLYFKYKGEFSPMIQIPRTIESLHELQNLYHALTGEELEVHL